MRQERIGGLTVRFAGGTDGQGSGRGPSVVLLHGFGAPGDDLAPLWQVVDAPKDTRFLFPEGPLRVPNGFGEGRAWWMIDLERIARDQAAGRPRDLSGEKPKGFPEARQAVQRMLADLARHHGVDMRRTVLGGFSQGAMLACDVTLRLGRGPAGLAVLSGTLLAQDEWQPLMPARRGLRVVQSHGTQDPLLPYAQAERLRDLMTQAGLAVDWVGFRGGHEIPDVALDCLGRLLRSVLAA